MNKDDICNAKVEKEHSKLTKTASSIARISIIAVGFLLVVAAILADLFRLSGPGIGRGQVIIALLGLSFISAGLIRRPIQAYKTLAVVILNTIVLLILLELIATVGLRFYSSTDDRVRESIRDRIAQLYGPEYSPYVVWKEREHAEEHLTILENGRRLTVGISQSPDAFEVFCFGGSTMIGWGISDSVTIPSLLQAELDSILDIPVRVENFGQQAYVSTQEIIELILQLRKGRRPDLVIFYDGVNDTFAAYQSGVAGVHENLAEIELKFEDTSDNQYEQSFLSSIVSYSNLLKLVKEFIPQSSASESAMSRIINYHTMGTQVDSLASEIVETYLSNCEIVSALADEYDFEPLFFWQPALGAGAGKICTEHEIEALNGMEPALTDLVDATWNEAYNAGISQSAYHYIGDCFDGFETELYAFGDFCHLNAEGNQIISSLMIDYMITDSLIPFATQ